MDNADIHNTMLALVHDPATHRLFLSDIPLPVPLGPDEHLVQVHAVALTDGELDWPEPAAHRPPIPGYELSGTVVHAPAASPFQPGTDVYALTAFARQGNAREYTIALTPELRQKPETISWEEAATVPLSALTAWQALFVHGGLTVPAPARPASRQSRQSRPASRASSRPRSITAADDVNANKRVLITAAAGGVGLWAVQLARLAGVGHIAATCAPANTDFVRSLGAHRVDLGAGPVGGHSGQSGRNSPVPGRARSASQPRHGHGHGHGHGAYHDKYDLVVDCAGGDALRRAWTSARHGGTVVSTVQRPDTARPDTGGVGMDVRGVLCTVRADGAQLQAFQAITELIEQRAVKAVFDSAFPLEQYEAAFARARSGHVRGQVVLRLA